MKVATACRRLINEYKSRPTLRSGSLITTVFGDAIAPRGGKVWLGSLIDEGRERFDQATHRIYGAPVTSWDGPLPPPSSGFLARFGGLDKPPRRKAGNG